mmetsp:Transcript_66943/g.186909  ORF Transcript_66943/g.186909 Transcript_66943/m.186909 type:complete len:219 (-) Transcript_66943:390-1046(-)
MPRPHGWATQRAERGFVRKQIDELRRFGRLQVLANDGLAARPETLVEGVQMQIRVGQLICRPTARLLNARFCCLSPTACIWPIVRVNAIDAFIQWLALRRSGKAACLQHLCPLLRCLLFGQQVIEEVLSLARQPGAPQDAQHVDQVSCLRALRCEQRVQHRDVRVRRTTDRAAAKLLHQEVLLAAQIRAPGDKLHEHCAVSCDRQAIKQFADKPFAEL